MYSKEQIDAAWNLAKSKGIQYFGSVGSNPKTVKSDKKTKYLTYICYLAPSTQSGYNVCAMASPGCANACLYSAGRGATRTVKEARIKRTRFWVEHPNEFKACIFDEISKHVKRCKKLGKKPAVRLNGTSDIVWERQFPEIFQWFTDVQYYEYTKIWPRMLQGWQKPRNLHLTLSRSETNQSFVDRVLQNNPRANVTVVFDKLPKRWMGRRVINGDDYDARFLDPKGVIVGLKQKGQAWRDQSGFVVRQPILPTIKGKSYAI